MAKYKIYTYGCQMNVHESEKLAGILNEMGYTSTEIDEEADIILFNTCCIRENAEQRLMGNVGALKPLKKKKKDLIVAVGGCMTEQNNVANKLVETFPFIDIVFGTHNLTLFKEYLLERLNGKKHIIKVHTDDGSLPKEVTPLRTSYPNAWVNIIYGCNNFCTYCIVPYVRGRERSRDKDEIISEVKHLVESGYKEITLLGQNVDSYGVGLPYEYDFADLLEDISKIEGKFRIRFMSNHPKDITEKVVKVIKNSDKICNYIHLPLQSGSSRILKLMNRHYTFESYYEKVQMIKKHLPISSISTDIMVGFPSETEEDFADTMKMASLVRFDGAFTFIYSRRKGTRADLMDEQIPEEIKKERIVKLIDLQNSINREKSLEYKNKIVEVLCEDFDTKKNLYLGRDELNRMIYFESEKDIIGEFVSVKITETGGISLYGELV